MKSEIVWSLLQDNLCQFNQQHSVNIIKFVMIFDSMHHISYIVAEAVIW